MDPQHCDGQLTYGHPCDRGFSDGRLPGRIEADAFQRLVDFFERLLAEVRDAQQVFARAVQQVVHGEDAPFFEAVGGADGEADFGGAHFESIADVLRFFEGTIERNAGHGGFPP